MPRARAEPGFAAPSTWCAACTGADYADTEALDRFAADVDVITYEFENVPAETATFLSARKPVLPDPRVLATTQDRLVEKDFVAVARHPRPRPCGGATRRASSPPRSTRSGGPRC